MSIIVEQNSKVLIQGITGKEGSRAAREMAEYGTNVVAGVTPGKGGQVTEQGVPVFDTIKEAKEKFPEISDKTLSAAKLCSDVKREVSLEKAQQLNNAIIKVFNEEQIYRIDHYLGKEMVQGILNFRFSNNLLTALSSAQ